MSVIFVVVVVIILVVLDLYGIGKEEGVLLGMMRNVCRWLNI